VVEGWVRLVFGCPECGHLVIAENEGAAGCVCRLCRIYVRFRNPEAVWALVRLGDTDAAREAAGVEKPKWA